MISAEVERPHPKLGLNVKTDDAMHTPIGHITFCDLHNGSLWASLSRRSKMDWESKERWLAWVFTVVSGWHWVRVCAWNGLFIVWISCCSQRKAWTFISACPDMGQKWKGEGRGINSARSRQWHPTPVLLPGKSHGWRSLVGCSPWGR